MRFKAIPNHYKSNNILSVTLATLKDFTRRCPAPSNRLTSQTSSPSLHFAAAKNCKDVLCIVYIQEYVNTVIV